MKKLVITLLMGIGYASAIAQESKQTRLMLEQLLKLKIQNKLSSSGNKQSSEGLGKIREDKNSSYSEFQRYYMSRKNVNQAVAQSDNIEKIKTLFFEIRKIFPLTIEQAANSGFFEFHEIQYFRNVYQRVEKDCNDIILTLNKVTASGNLEMNDADRLERIDQLYKQIGRASCRERV